MDLSGEQRIPAPRQVVWDALNDPETLKAAIPGCESIERNGDNAFAATVIAKVGPVKATFKGKVQLSDIVPPESYTIAGEGQGGAAGFGKGSAKVSLTDDGDGTLLRYEAKAQVGGKLAQIGSRLVDAAAAQMAREFFESFNRVVTAKVAPPPAEGAEAAPLPAAAPARGLPGWAWIGGLVVIALILLWFLSRR